MRDLRVWTCGLALGRRRVLGPRDARPPDALLPRLGALAVQRLRRIVDRGEPASRVTPARVPARARSFRWTRQRRGAAGASRRGLHAYVLGGADARDRIGGSARVAGGPRGADWRGTSSTGRVDRSR